VGFSIQHTIALLDRRSSDSLRQMAFARTAGAEKQRVFTLSDEGTGCQIEDQTAIHLGVETEVEVIQSSLRVAEGRLFTSPFQQTDAASGQFVRDQARDQIDGSHGFGLRLAQSCFEHRGHAAEPKLSQCTL